MPNRDEAIVAAHRHLQLSLPEIVRSLGLSVSRVSRIVAAAHTSTQADEPTK